MHSSRVHAWVQRTAMVAVAVPAIGIAFLVFREGALEPGGPSLNQAFHLGLGAVMLVLFADFVMAIRRSKGIGTVTALGAGGFVACILGAILSEVLGPPMLALIVTFGGSWAIVLLRANSGERFGRALPGATPGAIE